MAKVEKTQAEFNKYIDALPFTEKCKYMGSILNIVDFCNYTLFQCLYRKKDVYKHKGRILYECNRERVKQIKKILGNNKF